jgi:hypothetical protein
LPGLLRGIGADMEFAAGPGKLYLFFTLAKAATLTSGPAIVASGATDSGLVLLAALVGFGNW